MPAPIIPWQPSNIPQEIQEELNRRKINRSYKFIQNEQANWTVDSSGNTSWKSYRGPMVSWIRMCSNGAGHPKTKPPRERFVLFSGKGFYQTYGFKPPTSPGGSQYQVIGYTPEGEEHVIENSLIKPSDEPVNYPIHVPPPEVSKIEVIVQKELFRRATIEWVCFSWKQLVYMTPYFLVPGITCTLEWGWNHFNVKSLVDLPNRNKMQELWDNAYPLYFNNILYSNGNYDVIYGIITNFNWSIEGNKIICSTEITSKDRLYAGIAKNFALTVKSKTTPAEGGDIFQSIKDFLTKDDTAKSLRTLVSTPSVVGEEASLVQTSVGSGKTWYDILTPLQNKGTAEVRIMRRPYIYGLFSGRDDAMRGSLGKPKNKDWDFKVNADDANKIWINMGMVTQIINYFSALDSGAGKKQNAFYVDIQNTVINAHPNMISCDPRVLIPNSKSPKYQWGTVGQAAAGADHQYLEQYIKSISFDKNDKSQIPNSVLGRTFYQGASTCFRNDIDKVINFYRYKYGGKSPAGFAFPSDVTQELPETYRGLKKNQVEKDRSGLLSNVYIRYDLLKEAIDDVSSKSPSYADIYTYLFKVMQDAVDGFWDLSLVDADGVLTITDRKYVGKYALDHSADSNDPVAKTVYSFDYYDADSIIKSIKFKPQLSDAQATRTIYGEVNNKDSKYKYLDKNDVLDYKFRDCVIGTSQQKKDGDVDAELAKRISSHAEHQDMARKVQTINNETNDPSLQMSLTTEGGTDQRPNIVKLVLPDQQLLRMLLNDDDEESNARYCAVQPGIILELTLLGVGGLRTFQYFVVKNLPEPYSDRNIVFRITDVHQTLEAGNWETTIRAQPLPLRAYIKQRLRGPITDSNTPNDNGWARDTDSAISAPIPNTPPVFTPPSTTTNPQSLT
jgi:hypothetical protein